MVSTLVVPRRTETRDDQEGNHGKTDGVVSLASPSQTTQKRGGWKRALTQTQL